MKKEHEKHKINGENSIAVWLCRLYDSLQYIG